MEIVVIDYNQFCSQTLLWIDIVLFESTFTPW